MTKPLLQSEAMTEALMVGQTTDDKEQLISDGLATVNEVSRFLSLGRSKLYGLMDAGELPYCKIGRARRIPWRAVHALASDSLMLAS